MSLFIVLVLSIYALSHLFLWLRCKRVFSLGKGKRLALLLLLALFMLSPFLGRTLLSLGWMLEGQVISWLGYAWIGVFFAIFSLDGTLLILALLHTMGRKFTRKKGKPAEWIHKPGLLLTTLVVALCINLYGYIEASNIGVTRLDLVNPHMAPHAEPIRIIQVSDVHYGMTMLPSRHQKLIETVSSLHPHMIVSTGDFLDHGAIHSASYMDAWRALKPPMGKYAITGNHEVIAGLAISLKLLERAGFQLLRGEMRKFAGLNVIGLDDARTGISEDLHFSPEELDHQPGFTLLLNHRPGWPVVMEKRFDLALAGHTHGGQIFPFGMLVYLSHGILSGLHPTAWGGWHYISRGAGTWGPPVRILAKPEITLMVMHPGTTKEITLKQ